MKILYLNYSDNKGGAAIGAYRLHKAFLNHGIDSIMLTRHKYSADDSVIQYSVNISPVQKKYNKFVETQVYPNWRKNLNGTHSFNLRYSGVDKIINQSDADIVIMHWVGHDTIHLKEISNIKKPIIWRLADMWAFLGSAHYLENDSRYLSGYFKHQHFTDDLDAAIWHRKQRYFKNLKINFITGSQWLSQQVKQSMLFHKQSVNCIPSSIDTDIFKPLPNKKEIKHFWGLDNRTVLLFGAQNALNDPRKGYDLLEECLKQFLKVIPAQKIQLVIFGSKENKRAQFLGCETLYTGFIESEKMLAKVYNCADVMLVPSRIDNLPFTALEALSCGIPAVGYDVGGVPEIIDHKINGYVAQSFSIDDFVNGMLWIINHQNYEDLQTQARIKALREYSLDVQVNRYKTLIQSII